uniref:Tail fiber protein n=1 Tax=Pseudomonas phage Touem01 TaxID=3138548 RepID=A0AAU6W1W8_9VIRU
MSVQIDVDVVSFLGSSSRIFLGGDGGIVIQAADDATGSSGVLTINTDGSLGTTIEPIPAVHANKVTVNLAPQNPTDAVNKAALDAALSKVSTPAPVAEDDTGWVPLNLINGWMNYGSSGVQVQAPAAYRRIGKRVTLRGAIKNPGLSGYNNSNFARLPTGLYPGRQIQMILNNVDKPCPVKVQTDGFLYLVGVDATWLALDSVSFLID